MRCLLDSHAFIWWVIDSDRLSPAARALLEADDNEVIVSVASIWEIVIKVSLGKLVLGEDLRTFMRRQLDDNQFAVLPVALEHALAVHDLPLHHKDPFDRPLVAQARVERLPVVTDDAFIRRYDVQTLW